MLGVGVVDKSNICQSLLVLSPLFITGTLIWGNGAVSVVWILLLFPGHTFYVLPCFTASCRDIPQLSQVSAVLQWILTFNFIWNNINGSRKPFISQLVYIKCSQNTNDDANWHLPSKSPCFILHNMRRLFFFFFLQPYSPDFSWWSMLENFILYLHGKLVNTLIIYMKTLCLFRLYFCCGWYRGFFLLRTMMGPCGEIDL